MKKKSIAIKLIIWVSILFVKSCSPIPSSPDQVMIKAGKLADPIAYFQFALYIRKGVIKEADKIAIKLIQENYLDLTLNTTKDPDLKNSVIISFDKSVNDSYPVPDKETLKYFGSGLTENDKTEIGKIDRALILTFIVENTSDEKHQKIATKIMSELAFQIPGYIWDEETRLLFSKKYWDNVILASWEENPFDISKHIVIHQYKDGELARGVTLGMVKFGLPDLVINGFAAKKSSHVNDLINIVSQIWIENKEQGIKGYMDLDFQDIKNTKVKLRIKEALYENGKGQGRVYLKVAKLEEGDAKNRLFQLNFKDFIEKNTTEKQAEFFNYFFGYEDKVFNIKHDEKLLAASDAAKKKLSGLRAEFKKGLKSGTVIMVKAPFKTWNNEQEWMWVEVTFWEGEKIRGILQNVPQSVPGLKQGQKVSVNQSEVFDYVKYFPDGSMEGDETSRIIEKMSQK